MADRVNDTRAGAPPTHDSAVTRSFPPVARDPLFPFGLELIDAETGGLIRDKLYLLYGPPAAWKTAAALYFVQEGLRADQRTLYVTSQDPDAVIVQADRLGFNLRPPLLEGRLTLLSYKPRISQHLAQLRDYRLVLNELNHLAGPGSVERVVFDPIEVLISQENKALVLSSTRLLLEALKNLEATVLCLFDENDEPHHQVIFKELLFQSFGAFEISIEEDDSRVFRFRKVTWNPREYPRIPLTLRGRQGVQVLEPARHAPTPRLALAASGHPDRPPAAPIDLPRTVQVLLVDNDDMYHEMLQDFLTDRYHVEQVRDSVEAISRLLEHSYDVILVNMNMPRVDGREVCLRIRQHQGSVPLVAFSNKLKRGADVAGILRIGADTFIPRPFAFNQVKATLEAVLRRPASPGSFDKARELIKAILEEERLLRTMPRIDPATGLDTLEFFEKKVRKELEKARLGDYSFSLVGYAIRARNPAFDLESRLADLFRPILRADDLVSRYAPGCYLTYLEECLTPGVKRLNDRLKRAIQQAARNQEIELEYQIATFPNDARSFEELMALVLKVRREAPGPLLKRIP